jgi:hypothetical protein
MLRSTLIDLRVWEHLQEALEELSWPYNRIEKYTNNIVFKLSFFDDYKILVYNS